MSHCLDSWAALAWLDGDEPAATLVADVFAHERPAMSWVNLVEVESRVRRRHGAQEAVLVLERLRGLVREDLPGVTAMRSAAALKAEHAMTLADCFAVTTAAAGARVLITGDPEMIEHRGELPCAVRDARPV